jgi:hypothetical protein
MRHHALIVAAASLALTAVAVPSFAADARATVDVGNSAPMDSTATTRPANQLTDAERANILNTLGDITQAALTQNGVKDAVAYFTTEDADRIGTVKQSDELNNAIAQFNKDWQDKYGQPFELKHDSKVFDDASFRLTPGMGMHARQAGERITPSDQNTNMDENKPSDQNRKSDREGDKSDARVLTHTGTNMNANADMNAKADTATAQPDAKAGAGHAQSDIAVRSSDNPAINTQEDRKDNARAAANEAARDQDNMAKAEVKTDTEVNRDQAPMDMTARDNQARNANARDMNANDTNTKDMSDRAVKASGHMNANADAQLTIGANNNLPQTTLNLVKARHWLVDVSDSLTADNLQTNLLHAVQAMDQDKANWPADINDGYRMAASHVFMALQDRTLH